MGTVACGISKAERDSKRRLRLEKPCSHLVLSSDDLGYLRGSCVRPGKCVPGVPGWPSLLLTPKRKKREPISCMLAICKTPHLVIGAVGIEGSPFLTAEMAQQHCGKKQLYGLPAYEHFPSVLQAEAVHWQFWNLLDVVNGRLVPRKQHLPSAWILWLCSLTQCHQPLGRWGTKAPALQDSPAGRNVWTTAAVPFTWGAVSHSLGGCLVRLSAFLLHTHMLRDVLWPGFLSALFNREK